jgi:hypothetical protein
MNIDLTDVIIEILRKMKTRYNSVLITLTSALY